MDIIISIKPEFLAEISAERKKVEFRNNFTKKEINRVYFYSTGSKDKKAILSAKIYKKIRVKKNIALIINKYLNDKMRAKSCLKHYLKQDCWAIFLYKIRDEDLKIKTVPQNFIYKSS